MLFVVEFRGGVVGIPINASRRVRGEYEAVVTVKVPIGTRAAPVNIKIA
jgi:hypothetical protein